ERGAARDRRVGAATTKAVCCSRSQVEKALDVALQRQILIKLVVQVRSDSRAGRVHGGGARSHLDDLGDVSRIERQFERRGFADVDFNAGHVDALEAGLLHFHLVDAWDQVLHLELTSGVYGDCAITGRTQDSDFGVRDGGAGAIGYAPADSAF